MSGLHAELARAKKTARIVAYLSTEFGPDALRAANLASEAQWEAIAVSAGVLLPSEETRAEVRRILASVKKSADLRRAVRL